MMIRRISPLIFSVVFSVGNVEDANSAAPVPVSVALSLPTKKTHVIGDATELSWHFANRSTNLLAFMWEGCCRINGRVEMKRLGPPVLPKDGVLPRHSGYGTGIYSPSCLHCRLERQKSELNVEAAPMGPATAHMFARAVRLPAGGAEQISSLLSNWVLLEESGDYQLTGSYLGVHPKQSPQMPRGARLWTETATSEPLPLTLLSVSDYLSEREPRARLRGLSVELAQSGGVAPFADLGFRVTLSNRTATNITLHWPGQAEFWIVDAKDRRLAESRHVITRYGDALTIPPGEAHVLPLPVVASDVFAENEFGVYRAFVELKETDTHLRTPSNPLPLDWQLATDQVEQLLNEAGGLPSVGHRNPALKLLRQHLPELRETLSRILPARLGPKAAILASELRTAATLSRLHPRPGQVSLHIAIPPSGSPTFQDPPVLAAFPDRHAEPAAVIVQVTDLRRHLGWSVGLTFRIAAETPMTAINGFLKSVEVARTTLAGPPETKAFNRTATAFSKITFASPGTPGRPEDLRLNAHPDGPLKALPAGARLIAPATLTWTEVLRQAAPLIDEGRAFELLITE